jgi:hypothetical protein
VLLTAHPASTIAAAAPASPATFPHMVFMPNRRRGAADLVDAVLVTI